MPNVTARVKFGADEVLKGIEINNLYHEGLIQHAHLEISNIPEMSAGMGNIGPVSAGRRDEVVLITGCSDGGIGVALAFEFCECDFTVVATSRSLSTVTVFEGHQNIELLPLDLLSEESIKEALESVVAPYDRIDILVNNASTLAWLAWQRSLLRWWTKFSEPITSV